MTALRLALLPILPRPRNTDPMTYAQVVDIIGAEGVQTSHSELFGNVLEMRKWSNPDMSSASIQFSGGVVDNRMQFRLQ